MKPALPISLCMIAKNESENLTRNISKIASWVSEFIYVDTGSSDDSIALAEARGACVFHKAWENDFASVRNFALEKARQPWILVLDADEVISERDFPKVADLLTKNPDAGGFVFRQRSYLSGYDHENWIPNHTDYAEGRGFRGYMDVSVVRLFQNSPEVRYTGASHDLVEYSIADRVKIDTGIPIHHYGMAGPVERQKEKDTLYLAQIEKDLEAHPDIFKTQFTYGRQLYRMGRMDPAISAFSKALQLRPDSDYAELNLGMAYLQCEKFKEARHFLLRSLQKRQENPEAWNALGIVCIREGLNEDALRCFSEALKLNPENPKFQNNQVAVLIELEKLPEGLTLINALLEQYPDYVLAWINRLKLARLQKDWQGVVLLGRKIIKMDPLMAPTVQSLLDS